MAESIMLQVRFVKVSEPTLREGGHSYAGYALLIGGRFSDGSGGHSNRTTFPPRSNFRTATLDDVVVE